MTYPEAIALAASRTRQTGLVHVVRSLHVGGCVYYVFMTGQKSELYK
jgi:hypothetical protein